MTTTCQDLKNCNNQGLCVEMPGEPAKCEITHTYGREEALEVIRRSQIDYNNEYGSLEEMMSSTLMEAMSFGQRRDKILNSLS